LLKFEGFSGKSGAYFDISELQEFQKTAKLEIVTTYQGLADFSRDLLMVLNGTAPEAFLKGELLP
jgi:hypothetical protein